MIRKVKVEEEEEDREAHKEAEWPQHLALRPSPFPPPDLGSLAAAYKLESGAPGTLGGLALAGWVPTASEKPYGCGECERRFRDQLTLRLHQRLHRGEGPCACPDCGRQIEVFGQSHLEEIAQRYNIPLTAKLPIDSKLAGGVDKGMIELFNGDWLDKLADAIYDMVKK